MNGDTTEAKEKLNEIYGIDNFFETFDMLRNMIQGFILGYDALKQMSYYDLMFGYDEPKLEMLFDEMDIF